MEWLRRNGWESLDIGSITEYHDFVSVIGTHGGACVSLKIDKPNIDRIELHSVPARKRQRKRRIEENSGSREPMDDILF
jgi:hypothetical protein